MGEGSGETTRGAKPGAKSERGRDETLQRGAALGRYVVLDHVGAGAMGAVYAAYDPELDRKVALKVVRDDAGSEEARRIGQARLLREAQAMARIGHPNVIQVFDVGTFGESIYIAMEFVDGDGLGVWQKGREVRAVVAAYAQAARGLEYAHRAGVVHRDFKPDNCLVDASGRVRVIDFGIARHRPSEVRAEVGAQPIAVEALARHPETSPTAATQPLETSLGMLIGTPAYMSPEQFAGAGADAKSDQFAFCVALYEALYRTRPFGGGNVLQLMNAVTNEAPAAPPRQNDVPDAVRDAVLRGLSREPDERHESMAQLAAVLEPSEPEGVSRGRWLSAALALAVAVALGVAARGFGDDEVCQDLGANLAGTWDAGRRSTLEERLAATAAPTLTQLDAYAEAWVDARQDACEATRVRREQTEEVYELRVACLDRRRDALAAVTGVLLEADEEVRAHAAQLVSDLPRVEPCADLERLRAAADHRPPPELAVRVAETRAELLAVEAVRETGQYALAVERAEALAHEARGIDYAPLQAEIRLLRSRSLVGTGDLSTAKDELFEAARLAWKGGDRTTEAEAWVDLVFVTGTKLRNREAGLRWARFAEVALERAGRDPLIEGRLRYYEGLLYSGMGQESRALEEFDRAERAHQQVLPEGHWRFGVLESARAAVLRRSSRQDEARAAYERSLANLRAALGDEHPNVAMVLGNLAIVLRELGDLAGARDAYEEALRLKRATLGENHPSLAFTLVNLANLERRTGRYARAEALLLEARSIREGAVGAEHPLTVSVLAHQAELMLDRGEFGAAVAQFRAVLTMTERHGEAYPTTVAQNNLAWALARAERYDEAEPLARGALSGFLESEVDAMHLAFPRTLLGLAFVERGRPEEAVGPLTAALETRAESRPDPEAIGLTGYALGRALFESGRDRSRGYALVEEALSNFTEAGAAGMWGRDRAAAWLEAHERPPVEMTTEP
ncbi:MAG: tetratricopeptide repeat protein [Sandaracinaceae bacterium]